MSGSKTEEKSSPAFLKILTESLSKAPLANATVIMSQIIDLNSNDLPAHKSQVSGNNFSFIHPLPVLEDNIIWIWTYKNEAVVVDPAIANPVIEWLEKRDLKLIAVLQTHHHDDHIGGTEALARKWPDIKIIASKDDFDRIPFQNFPVKDGDEISLFGYSIKILGLPGHTSSHIGFYVVPQLSNNTNPLLFCGDTLFGAGCGRVFEGSNKQMYISIQKINALPKETLIFCAHEYTEKNILWALSLKPNSKELAKRLSSTRDIIKNGLITIPFILEKERETNLFLKSRDITTFSLLRNHKNNWK